MSPSVQQAKLTAMRDNEIVALVVLPSGEVIAFSEPVAVDGLLVDDEDQLALAVVGLTAQINLRLLRN